MAEMAAPDWRIFDPEFREEYCGNKSVPRGLESAQPAPVTPETAVSFVEEHLEELVLPGKLTIQPEGADVLVNKPAYFASTAVEYEEDIDILGTPVTLRFTPTAYQWDSGSGDVFTTTNPGGPWPEGDAKTTYEEPGRFTPSVTVTWRVDLRIAAETTWHAVPGNATTTAVGEEIIAVEAEAVLVHPK